jgi:hypothetical protein
VLLLFDFFGDPDDHAPTVSRHTPPGKNLSKLFQAKKRRKSRATIFDLLLPRSWPGNENGARDRDPLDNRKQVESGNSQD